MLDEFARDLIETAKMPSLLTGKGARDLISTSYFRWLARTVFDVQMPEETVGHSEELNRLSLASSLLQSIDDTDVDPTAFLIAESADVARMFVADDWHDLSPPARFRRAVHLLDLASFFHLADYDANASVVAREALSLLSSTDFIESGIVLPARLSYYRTLAFFLLGQFGNCRDEAEQPTETSLAEDRAFLFLRTYLGNLTNKYKGSDFDAESDSRVIDLLNVLQARDHPYFALAAEVTRLVQFNSVVERKSLYRMLIPIFAQERSYLEARVSSDDNKGYPFAWPPTQDFCSEYLAGKVRHAVITVPTGGGKGFLAELATAQALQNGWVLYLAPTNALCAQIKEDLKQNLSSVSNFGVEAFLGKLEYTAELPRFEVPRQVLAITPEKALLLLKRQPELFKNCSLVILDECQLLGSSKRGEIAEIVLSFSMAQNPEVRIILMSALVADGEKLAGWLRASTGSPVTHVSLPWRPTRTARMIVLPDWETLVSSQTEKGKRVESIQVRAFADTVTPWTEESPLRDWPTRLTLEHRTTKFRWRNDVSRKLAELFTGKGIATLVFVLHNRHHAFSIANDFEADIPDRPEITQREEDLYTLASYELGTDSLVESLINQKGVAVHTAVMLDCEREASEMAFNSGRARLLTATGTLSQGLNLVATVVIICGTHLSEYGDEIDISPEELERLSLNQVLNAAGRAARANIACRGVSIIVPDNLILEKENLNQDTPKSRFISKISVLAMKDASLSVESSMRQLLEVVSLEAIDADVRDQERFLLGRLPADSERFGQTVQNLLGVYESQDATIAERVVKRLEVVRAQAIDSGYEEWVLGAGSLAGMDYELAGNLKAYIESRSNESDFEPPEDTYVGWAAFLIDWLRNLPAPATWDILRLHIEAWRYHWGKEKDPHLIKQLGANQYPFLVQPELLEALDQIWDNMTISVRAWLEGKTYLEISEVLTRRKCELNKRMNRTAAGNYLPRAIIWSTGFIDRLSQFSGLLLALQNQWVDNEPDSVPGWLANAVTLHTLPLGIRFGVQDPFALAWHRHVIQERRAANLLQSLVPLNVESITDLQEMYKHTKRARDVFISRRFGDEEPSIIYALRRIIGKR